MYQSHNSFQFTPSNTTTTKKTDNTPGEATKVMMNFVTSKSHINGAPTMPVAAYWEMMQSLFKNADSLFVIDFHNKSIN